MTAIELLWKQALKTFADRSSANFQLCQKNFEKLRCLLNKLTADDVKIDNQTLKFIEIQQAPMCVIDVFENEDITIAMFILKSGVTLPMHNHPQMHGLLKVLTGKVKIESFTMDDEHPRINKEGLELIATRHESVVLEPKDEACVLAPRERNLHEISCLQGPAAFLDVLSPPYSPDENGMGSRSCSIFKIVENLRPQSGENCEKVKLAVSNYPPDFWSRSIKYQGPPLR